MAWNDNSNRNLERLADAMERIANFLEKNTVNQILSDEKTVWGEDTISSLNSLEEEFFELVTNIYVEEEKIKLEKGLKRKSAVRISNKMLINLARFFNEHLDNIVASPLNGYIAFYREEVAVALFRFQTDLGFTRGESWNEAIEHGVNVVADKLDIPSDRVFFMVGSIQNSLDNTHVKKVLGTSQIPENSILLTSSYRELLNKYLEKYVQTLDHLDNPKEQVFFLAAGEHPNNVAWELVTNQTPIPTNIQWLQPSVTDLIEQLKIL